MMDFIEALLRMLGRVIPRAAHIAHEIGDFFLPDGAAPKNDGTDDPQETS